MFNVWCHHDKSNIYLVYASNPLSKAPGIIVSSAFVVRGKASEVYGEVLNTSSFQVSLKKVCPICKMLPE